MFLKDLEAIRPSAIIDIIHSGETFQLDADVKSGMKALRKSEDVVRCYGPSSPFLFRKLPAVWLHQLK